MTNDDLMRALRSGRLSRREVLQGATALGLAAAGATLLGAGPASADEMPKKGGNVRMGIAGGSTTDSLDPATWTDSVTLVCGFSIWNYLVENGPDNKPIPELAESYAAKPGAAEWVLNLRKGIKFSNGKEFDADDAIYSLNLHRGDTKSGAAGPMKAISDIKKLDTHQIQITLSSADADLPYVLSDYHLVMMPDGHKDWANPVGSGAYTLEKFDPGVRVALKRNPNYWKPGRANADTIEITVINDSSARLSALLSGQVDLIHRVDPKTVALVMKKSESADGARARRLARDHADDDRPRPVFERRPAHRAEIRDRPRGGAEDDVFRFRHRRQRQPDPARRPVFQHLAAADRLRPGQGGVPLQEGRLPGRHSVQASDAAFGGAVDMAQLFQNNAKKAGITIEVKKEPADGFWDNVWLKAPFMTSYWGGRPAATQMFGVAYKSDAPWNDTHWKVPEFDKLLSDARAELDEGKRKQYLWTMQAMLHENGGALIPVFRDWLDAHSTRIGGHTPHSGFDLDNGRICEKVWVAA